MNAEVDFVDQLCHRLALPQTAFEVSLKGLPGYFNAPRQWAVDHHQPLQEHLIYYITDGGFLATIAQETVQLQSHSFFWVLPGQMPAYRHSQLAHLKIYRFRLTIRDIATELPYVHIPALRESREWFEKIMAELAVKNRHTPVRLRALLLCLFTEIALRLESPVDDQSRIFTRYEQNELSQRLAVQPLHDWLGPKDLANHLGFSHDYFSRVFRNTFEKTPRTWLVEQRLAVARTYLLETNMTVTEIAEVLGYESVYFFSRQFKQFVGLSPTQYRQ